MRIGVGLKRVYKLPFISHTPNCCLFIPLVGSLIEVSVEVSSMNDSKDANTEQMLCFTVVDSGVGISDIMKANLFQPFVTAQKSAGKPE